MSTLRFMVLAALLSLPVLAVAEDNVDINKRLAELLPDQKPDSIGLSPIPGYFEVTYGTMIFYISKDGRYMLQGDVVDLSVEKNLTEDKRGQARLKLLSTVPVGNMIVFEPKQVKHTITVFTDIDCGFCRKMHSEIAQYNQLGIQVRYLAFPRTGIDSPSYDKAVSVWCAKDRNQAITDAKVDKPVEAKTCPNPVKQEFEMGKKIGVTGTPTLVLEDGSLLPGYVPPDRLLKLLDEHSSKI